MAIGHRWAIPDPSLAVSIHWLASLASFPMGPDSEELPSVEPSAWSLATPSSSRLSSVAMSISEGERKSQLPGLAICTIPLSLSRLRALSHGVSTL